MPRSCAKLHIRAARFAWCALVLALASPVSAAAQGPPDPPRAASEPKGFLNEPEVVTRIALFADRHYGKGDLPNGFKVNFGHLIPGSGPLTLGPGYRHWYANDRLLFDASAAISTNRYTRLQARIDAPRLAGGRVYMGTEFRFQDFRHIDFFGEGPASLESARTNYHLRSSQIAGYVTVRPLKTLSINGEAGWMRPNTDFVPPGSNQAILGARAFVPVGVSATIDTRDFPSHPMRGGVLRASAVHYSDRHDGAFSFNQYEGQAAAFLPLIGGRVVLGLHGWATASNGDNVPFYMQPSLGGSTTLRSFRSYRFHDRDALVTNAEARVAVFTHADLVLFVDAGNVAPTLSDLDLAKRSYGAGLRLHTRRQTFALVDIAHGTEGWHFLLRINDPLNLSRTLRRYVSVPFVP